MSLLRTARARDRLFRPLAWEPGYLELACVAATLLAVFPFLAFSPAAGTTAAGEVVNVVTHLFGFSLTFLSAYLLPRVVAVLPMQDGGAVETFR